ncbi:SLOG family protein [Paenibacillus sp. RC67]|uniref:SLOG family protein n=1 Tax=Paenibacillus sp. RC67 TaxID=3039392 RepID=UPI0024ADAF1B|nr:SLOG family protein [Paenibacillus sp. RC67]
MNRILVTGYKAAELGIYSLKHPGIPIIKKAIKKQVTALIDEGLEWIIVSGQWGVELWAAEAVLELQETYEQLQLAVITPFLEQEEKWSDEKKSLYASVLQRANYVNSVTKSKYDGPWQFKEKNKFLLRNSDGIILLYDEEKEGSPKFIKEQALAIAKTQDYRIFSITANDLQNIVEEEQMEQY